MERTVRPHFPIWRGGVFNFAEESLDKEKEITKRLGGWPDAFTE